MRPDWTPFMAPFRLCIVTMPLFELLLFLARTKEVFKVPLCDYINFVLLSLLSAPLDGEPSGDLLTEAEGDLCMPFLLCETTLELFLNLGMTFLDLD